jgi:Spy/CpxP family protein refolding chaperone
MTKLAAALATIIILGVAAPLLAAPGDGVPAGKWWQQPEVVRTLSLSAAQQSRLEAIFVATANDLIDLKTQVEKDAMALRAEIDRPDATRENALAYARRLNESRGQLFERELGMMLEMRSVLSREQWQRFRQEFAGRGPGRAMGPQGPRQPMGPQRPGARRPPGRRP